VFWGGLGELVDILTKVGGFVGISGCTECVGVYGELLVVMGVLGEFGVIAGVTD
jgi:hypothetical protein